MLRGLGRIDEGRLLLEGEAGFPTGKITSPLDDGTIESPLEEATLAAEYGVMACSSSSSASSNS
jgi:hypothetical protein